MSAPSPGPEPAALDAFLRSLMEAIVRDAVSEADRGAPGRREAADRLVDPGPVGSSSRVTATPAPTRACRVPLRLGQGRPVRTSRTL